MDKPNFFLRSFQSGCVTLPKPPQWRMKPKFSFQFFFCIHVVVSIGGGKDSA